MSIVVVSDVHLGTDEANEEKFIKFLKELDFEKIEHFILLGDIIDIWRRDFTKAVIECSRSLTLLNDLVSKTQVHYIVGNHDYYLLRLSELYGTNFPFDVKKSTIIKSKYQEFYFMHGYQLEVLCNPYYKSMKTYETFSEHMCLAGDDTGNAADALWKLRQSNKSLWNKLKRIPENPYAALKSMMEPPEVRIRNIRKHNAIGPIEKLAEAESKHFLLDIRPEQFLVYGHTHHPYINEEKMVANTGSWGLGDQKKFWYMEIVDDKVDLKEFD